MFSLMAQSFIRTLLVLLAVEAHATAAEAKPSIIEDDAFFHGQSEPVYPSREHPSKANPSPAFFALYPNTLPSYLMYPI